MDFTGERIVPGATNCEPAFAQKMYQEHIARYAFASQLVEGKDVLDVACGVGYGSQWLAKAGAKSVLGIDIAKDAIGHAKKSYFHPAVSYKVADATLMNFDGEFDVVSCFEFIEHVDEQEKVLDGIRQALKPGGVVILSTPRPLDDKRTDFHVHELDYEELRQMLLKRFEVVEAYFEKNWFTSFVGAKTPESVDRIVPTMPTSNLEEPDYFIFVARTSKAVEAGELLPVLSVSDDSYVTRLEGDIVNLRNGENYHNELITDLSERSKTLQQDLGSTKSELDKQRARADRVDDLHGDIARMAQDLAAVRDAVDISAQVSVANEQVSVANEQIERLRNDRDELVRQNEGLAADNLRVRTALSKLAQQLAETETRLTARSQESSSAAAAQRELVAAREHHAREMEEILRKYEQSERTLARFRGSVSWAATRPIRWVGRQYKRMIGRSVA